ncbi:hypothetical protein VE03_09587 [Pseudogymnoascus sp. 23342-1-I1]|nr:hypothetical protein VE03_09587 [Pseudogymnoascus sp. 23342-1-I1]
MTGKKVAFTHIELKAIEYAERVTSAFSIGGCFFVIVTFTAMKIFRKPINRLVFFATFGNLATNVATLISRSGIWAGNDSAMCQIQAFLIQTFMPADALWMLSMALNVYLTFFHRYSGDDLIALERYYIAFNYGVPLVPALVFVFTSTEERGRIFGDATLWCWVNVRWNTLRIATFYGPVWVVLLTTMGIYIVVGKVVFENQARFRELSKIASRNQANMAAAAIAAGADPSNLEQGLGSRTTEVSVTSMACSHRNRLHCKLASCTVKVETSTSSRSTKGKKEVSSADRAAWSYLKCALLFFTAMIVTWVPATTNRVVTLVDPTIVSFGLNFTEALLLPLQGFFNCMIYISISTDACNYLRPHCKRMFRMIFITPFVVVFIKPLQRALGRDIPLEDLTPRPADPNVPHSYGSSQMAPPRRFPRGYVHPIQPEELEDYERLHKKLNISPEPGSSAGDSSA